MKIEVTIKPNSPKQELIKVSEREYKIHLRKQPIENKANLELIKLLKKHFKKEVKILSGKTSKKKLIELY